MTKHFILNSQGITVEVADRNRRRKRGLRGEVHADAAAAMPRRNDLLPALKLEVIPITSLTAPARELRKLHPEHLAEVTKSIAVLGVSAPIIVSTDREIINGVAVWHAARDLGLTEIPCIVVEHLSPADLRLLRIALNRLGEKGAWDLDALKVEFSELIDIGKPLEIAGFITQEIDLVLAADEPAIDETANTSVEPDTNGPPVTRPGDIWLLGKHRLLCGNAVLASSYEQVMEGCSARAVFTDPAYNIPIQGFVTGQAHHREFVMGAGEMSNDEFTEFLTDFFLGASRPVVDGGVLFVCMDFRHIENCLQAARMAGLTLVTMVVWHKGVGGMGRLYRSAHELVLVLKKGSGSVLNNIELGKHGRDRTNVWEYPGANRPGSSANEQLAIHSTPKPVELVADALLDVTQREDIVLDPFMGSGTTFIAAEKTGRIAFGMEFDPVYCDAIVQRFEKYTGTLAQHAQTGLTFAELATRRREEARDAGSGTDGTPCDIRAGGDDAETIASNDQRTDVNA